MDVARVAPLSTPLCALPTIRNVRAAAYFTSFTPHIASKFLK